MAIGKKGINGNFSGKVGSIIGYELGGQQVIRVVGARTKPFSELERLNQARMKAVSQFLAPIRPFIKKGFQAEALKKGTRVGAFQTAQSYTYKNAIDYDAQNQPYVNPAKVLISKGVPAPVENATAEWNAGILTLRWQYRSTMNSDAPLFLLLYDGVQFRGKKFVGAFAKAEIDIWETGPLSHENGPVHIYGWFETPFFNALSDSIYFGSI